ncbi:MAG: radical SAM protein [Caldilineaceae bacterium]|nr:radical SAM protein [Caldilineaceae bacterium]
MPSILLLSCYELGHQPLSLAWPLAMLRAEGMDVAAVDLAVDAFPEALAEKADLVGIAVPMLTALRIGVDAARRVRTLNPGAHICFYGLYAWMNADYLLRGDDPVADSVLAGEAELALTALARTLRHGGDPSTVPGVTTVERSADPLLSRVDLLTPDRSLLPGLDRYARYMADGEARLAGYVEATRGCLHTCRHCPVVPIYNGRFFAVPAETVLADIRQQVDAGAQHITFGDPDFLNGPGHARRIARSLHERFPAVTFDFTTKVEHILEHPDLIAELAGYGATFVVSAFESTTDLVLSKLDKGHTVADMERALRILRDAGIAPQPTWMPFTPWTSLDDYLHMLSWIRAQGLIPYVPAVQLSIRMLAPPGSALLDDPDVGAWIGPLDAANFTYRWDHPDPRVDELQRQVTRIAAHTGDDDPYAAFAAVERAAYALADQAQPEPVSAPYFIVQPPKLSEHWFC